LRRKLLLIGGGGHCHSVLDSAIALDIYDELGVIDNIESSCLGVPVIGTDNDLPVLVKDGWNCAIVTVGSVGNTKMRRRLYEMIQRLGFTIPSIIDPTAIIAKGVLIKNGCFIGKRAVVNTGAVINECCIINTGAIIEHDCKIGAFAHISPGTTLCGQVRVGSDSHIGAGSVVRQQITVGESSLIGAGSVVVKDIAGHVKAYGNPCMVVE
jgi:sugar O-acyltransferase (sialic acid O-acetyltransferase NeuD family)